MAPLICMLKTWFAYHEIYNDNSNIWDIKRVSSMHVMGCMIISMSHVTGNWVTFNNFASSVTCLMETTFAPLICMLETWCYINRFTMTVTICWDINKVFSMHIMGCMTISMKHVVGNWVTFNNFALPRNMPHGNIYGPLNMHARDMVCLSRDSQWQWQYFEI